MTLVSSAPTEIPDTTEPAVDPGTNGQYHSQDGSGAYTFGYWSRDQRRQETRDRDGRVQGSYSYTNPGGEDVRVFYEADKSGFRSSGSHHPVPVLTGLPQPVQELPHVEAARQKHLEVHALEKARIEALKKLQEEESEESDSKKLDDEEDAVVLSGTDTAGQLGEIIQNAAKEQAETDEKESWSQKHNPNHHFLFPNHIVDDETDAVLTEGIDDQINPAPPSQSQIQYVQSPHPFDYYPPHLNIKNVQPQTVSYKAAVLGAIPPAAVHDTQVAPYQDKSLYSHQLLPVFLDFGNYAIISRR